MSWEEDLRDLHRHCGEALESAIHASTLGEAQGLQSRSHGFMSDLAVWIGELSNRPELPLYKTMLREYQFALLAIAQGQYREAFMGLRLSLELCLAGVLWSANELAYREWEAGERDIVWSQLIADDCGVFSKRFVRAFFKPLCDDTPHYRLLAATVYRECSEFVHGSAITQAQLPHHVSFDPETFRSWHAKANSIRLVCSFALAARYAAILPASSRLVLENVLLDNLGHLPSVRSLLTAPGEVIDA